MKKTSLFLGTLMCLSVQFINAQNFTTDVQTTGRFKSSSNYGLELSPSASDAIIRRTSSGNLMFASGGGSSSIYLNYAYGSGSGGVKIYDGGTSNYTNLKVNSIGDFSIISKSGKVGIGTTTPASKLEVNGDISLKRTYRINFLEPNSKDNRAFIGSTNGSSGDFNSLVFGVKTEEEAMRIRYDGNVGIGTTNPDSPLTVNGKIHATEVLVDTNIFADYVFNANYNLKPLEEVENFIKEEGHLEGFKSEKEIVEEGLNLKEVTIKQQEKIEELTLYLIELSKEVKSLKAQLKN